MNHARLLESKRFESERLFEFVSAPSSSGQVCTLLLPRSLRASLESYLRSTGKSLGSYLGGLLKKNRGRMMCANWGISAGCFRHYQAQGLELCRRNFRAQPIVWYELGLFAAFLGSSRCHLFVKLIEFDLYGYPDGLEGVPTGTLEEYDQYFPKYIETTVKIEQGRKVARRIIQIPKDELDLPLHFFPFPPPEDVLRAWLRRKYNAGC